MTLLYNLMSKKTYFAISLFHAMYDIPSVIRRALIDIKRGVCVLKRGVRISTKNIDYIFYFKVAFNEKSNFIRKWALIKIELPFEVGRLFGCNEE